MQRRPAGQRAVDGGVARSLATALGCFAGISFAAFGTLVIAGILKAALGLRVTDEEERDGLDITLHGERGYHHEIAG